jgi:hypothetical protein
MHSNADPSQVGLGGREIDRKVLTFGDEVAFRASGAPSRVRREGNRPVTCKTHQKMVFGIN